MKYILGLDQGGSKTHALVSDENGIIIGMGESYGACHSGTGVAHAVKAMEEAWKQALETGGISMTDVTTVVGGLTGIDWDYEEELLTNALREHFPHADVKVVNDSIIAMKAATKKSKCAILCVGSGFNCAIQNEDACYVYGFYIPDEHQGGWSLGKTVVQAVIDSHIGFLPKTSLTERVLNFFKLKTVDELLYRRVKKMITAADYLKLPPIIEEEACRGDQVAGDIWKKYAKTISGYVTIGMKEKGMTQEDVDIVLSGSIFKCTYKEFQSIVKEEICQKLPKANIIVAKYEPVIGAVVMGLQRLQGQLSEEVYENIRESSRKYPLRRMAE